MPDAPFLEVVDLDVRFGGVVAVDHVSFGVPQGELLGIIGPNGAGKTTMLDALGGFVPHRGRVLLAGRDVSELPAPLRARAGIGRSFQDAALFPSLTVREAVALAVERRLDDPGVVAQLLAWPTARLQAREVDKRAEAAIETYGLGDYADKFVAELSTGTRRIVELACVSMQEPRLIILDEPSSGIAQREVEALGDVVLRLREMTGGTILMVEHDIPLVRQVADRLLVLEYGRQLALGPVDEVLRNPQVIAGYLGSEAAVSVQRSGRLDTPPIVEVGEDEALGQQLPALPPGIPARDDFRVPARRLASGAGVAAACLLALPLLPGTGFKTPAARVAARSQRVAAQPLVTPSPTAEAPPPFQLPATQPAPAFAQPASDSAPSESASPSPPASASPSPSPASPPPSCLLPTTLPVAPPSPLPC